MPRSVDREKSSAAPAAQPLFAVDNRGRGTRAGRRNKFASSTSARGPALRRRGWQSPSRLHLTRLPSSPAFPHTITSREVVTAEDCEAGVGLRQMVRSVRHQSACGWHQGTAIRSAVVAGVPASGAGPRDLKSNSGVCERSVGAATSTVPVFFPGNGGMTPGESVAGELGAVHIDDDTSDDDRTLVEIVDRLDLSELERAYGGGGKTPYHPAVMVALLFYGFPDRTLFGPRPN